MIYAKPPVRKPKEFVFDLIKTGGPDTSHHIWGQRRECIDVLVQKFSTPGDLVFDPFCGGGTVAESCVITGRDCICCDCDEASVATTKKRVATAAMSLPAQTMPIQ
jgi:hypothetical protein